MISNCQFISDKPCWQARCSSSAEKLDAGKCKPWHLEEQAAENVPRKGGTPQTGMSTRKHVMIPVSPVCSFLSRHTLVWDLGWHIPHVNEQYLEPPDDLAYRHGFPLLLMGATGNPISRAMLLPRCMLGSSCTTSCATCTAQGVGILVAMKRGYCQTSSSLTCHSCQIWCSLRCSSQTVPRGPLLISQSCIRAVCLRHTVQHEKGPASVEVCCRGRL